MPRIRRASAIQTVASRALAAWLAIGSLGCNGVLGIDAPSDRLLLSGSCPSRDAGSPDTNTDAGIYDNGDEDDGGTLPPALPSDAGVISNDPDDELGGSSWASWPMPNPDSTGLGELQSYELSSDDLVLDRVTQLQWQRGVDAKLYDFEAAAQYCAALDLPGGAFRVPTRIELLSLLDFTAESPSIDQQSFPDTPAEYFWSSSPFVGAPNTFWVITFGKSPGFASSSDPSSTYHVRCVR